MACSRLLAECHNNLITALYHQLQFLTNQLIVDIFPPSATWGSKESSPAWSSRKTNEDFALDHSQASLTG